VARTDVPATDWISQMRLRIPAILVIVPLLSGCFLSDAPLITEETADYPFMRMNYEAYPSERFVYTPDGPDTTDTLILRDGVYRLTAEADRAAEILVRHVGDGLYIIQLMPGGADDPYLYFAATLDRDEMRIVLHRAEALPGDFRPGAAECEPEIACLSDIGVLADIARESIAAGERPVAWLDIFELH